MITRSPGQSLLDLLSRVEIQKLDFLSVLISALELNQRVDDHKIQSPGDRVEKYKSRNKLDPPIDKKVGKYLSP